MVVRWIKSRFFSDKPVLTVVELAIASIFVGAALAFFNVSPITIWRSVAQGMSNLVTLIADSASGVVMTILSYLLLGAAIVVPVFLVTRIFIRPRAERGAAARAERDKRDADLRDSRERSRS